MFSHFYLIQKIIMKKLFLIPFLLFAAVAVASAGCGGCGSKSDDKPAASSECSDSQSDSSAKKEESKDSCAIAPSCCPK